MKQKDASGWVKAGFDLWMLGAEAGLVMAMRTGRIMAGGAAGASETELMVTEKIRAAMEMQAKLMSGAFGFSPLTVTKGTLTHYRGKVASNKRRLSKPRRKRSA